jgi:hypothetical protein
MDDTARHSIEVTLIVGDALKNVLLVNNNQSIWHNFTFMCAGGH